MSARNDVLRRAPVYVGNGLDRSVRPVRPYL